MTWSHRIRASHRWISIVFTLTVIATFLPMGVNARRQPPPWITYAPLLPLALLLCSGLYRFALPNVARARGGRRSAPANAGAATAD
jgi:hypothetical protein